MKAIPIIHILWYSFLFYLGFYYLELDRQLLDTFFEVGWSNYNGPPLDSPENSYFSIWLGSSLLSVALLLLFVQRKAAHFVVYIRWMSALFAVVYFFLYWADGDANMKETKIWWTLTSIGQLLGNGLLLTGNHFIQHRDKYLRQFFLFQALFYAALIGVGFYYLYWDWELLDEVARMGNLHHDNVMLREGRASKVPELNYHSLLVVATVLSLALLALAHLDMRWKSFLRNSLIGLLLYSFFIYLSNTYKYTMFGTMTFWLLGCGAVSAFSFLLYKNIEVAPEIRTPNYRDDVLDDFSGLG